MYVTNFVSKIDKKNVLRGNQFYQLKNHRWLYCKIETLGISLQLIQNPMSDYAI